MLIFPPVAFRAIWLIPGLFLMSMMMGGGQNISHTGHLGGVIVGWIYLRRQGHAGALFTFGQLKLRWKRYRMRQKLRAVRYEEFEEQRKKNDRKYH
jgi:membrane associated rhomboid family serine protease